MFTFSTDHLKNVFAEEGKFDNFKQLTYNLTEGNDIYEYDENGAEKKVSKAKANKAVQKVFMDVCGLTDADLKSRKKVSRAIHNHYTELFEIIEDDIERHVESGLEAQEWFNIYVEEHNLALGDGLEFRIDDPSAYFVVGDYSGDNHDVTMQQLPKSKRISVSVTPHVIKTGKDIDLIVLGRVDFSTWIDRISDSFVKSIQEMIYDKIYSAAEQLPDQFKQTGTLDKAKLDALIEDTATVNGTDVMIVGTKVALKKLNSLYNDAVQWIADSQKESVANTGRLGSYEGTALLEIPQKFQYGTLDAKVYDNNKLLILPVINDSPMCKYVTEGEVEIFEKEDKADLMDDFRTYEISRRYGCEIVLGRYFGQYEITE